MAEPSVAVIVVAAGSSSRMGGDVPKVYRALHGKMVIEHSLELFEKHPRISQILVVANPEHATFYAPLKERGVRFCGGGQTRQGSVYCGLDALADNPPDWVLVHDAARPNVSAVVIDRVLAALKNSPAVVPAIAVKDTISDQNQTLARDTLRAVQTPQGFHYPELLAAHLAAHAKEYTDDAAVMEAVGLPVILVDGDEINAKLTTPEDWARIQSRHPEHRVGQGYDVHALIDDAARPLMICGVEVPSALALKGHSDADVGLHALTDALLGAIGQGDIGEHFPPSDDRWKDADSSAFIGEAMRLVRARAGRIVNADITIIAETPKLMAHKATMRAKVAALLGVSEERINIKATTTEGLGFVGRAEGIAAQAVVSIKIGGEK
jgi:2-C-methyl-D-erythritol 4-phosphate cytidylyltransferase/2-C-methyl-D-erythritol 2,4-cyclodiphosphate synthase